MIVVDLYARVSTKEQAEEGYSIGEQEERLRKYAEANDWTVNAMYSDRGFSGSNLNRAGIISVINDVESGKVNKVVVYKLDRLSRSQKDTLHLIEDVFIPHGVDFVSLSESLDTGSAFGVAVIGMMSCFAQLERSNIRERMELGHTASVRQGNFRGGNTVPYGYRNNADTHKLEVNDFEAMLVRRMFDEYAAGSNAYQIAKGIQEDYPSLKVVYRESVLRMLKNPFYVGRQTWKGETYQIIDFPQFIPDELYDAVQQRIERVSRKDKPVSSHTQKALLGGLLWCGDCGSRLCRKASNSREDRYICFTNLKRHQKRGVDRCPSKSIVTDTLDNAVLAELRKLIVVNDIQDTSKTTQDEEIARIERSISSIDNQLKRMIDLYALGSIDVSAITEKIQELTETKEALSDELTKIKSSDGKLSTAEALNYITRLDELITDNADTVAVSEIIHILIKSITVKDDDITIIWNF